MMRILALAILSSVACYAQPATNATASDDDSSTAATTTTASESTTDDPSTSGVDTQIDPDTGESSTGPVECELARFDQSSFDAACFAP